jgi:sortase (surface protein transpeptidase)
MSQRVTLDEIDMRARLRPHGHAHRQTAYAPREAAQPSRKLFQDIGQVQEYDLAALFLHPESSRTHAQATELDAPKPVAVSEPVQTFTPRSFAPPAREPRAWKQLLQLTNQLTRQRVLTASAVLVLIVGGSISIAGFRSNALAKAQAAKAGIAAVIPATTTGSGSSAPSTAPVAADTLAAYQVSPDAARYIRIPKLGVWARVLQVGVTKDGALATPSNVFDAAWYKGSVKPGQPGATLIDGHVSSWTTNGVFYGIKNLVAGDQIEIEKGDGAKLEYTVVQTVAYPADAVDMKSLMKPVTTDKSGLNLITCGGKYDREAGEFTQRIAVYAALN